jgi:hypothetical protein
VTALPSAMEIAMRRGFAFQAHLNDPFFVRIHLPENNLIKPVAFCTAMDISVCDDTYLEQTRATTTYAPLGVPVMLREAAPPV